MTDHLSRNVNRPPRVWYWPPWRLTNPWGWFGGEMSVPGLAGNENSAGNPIVGTIESDREVLALRAKVRRLEFELWCRKWVATYGAKS